MTRLIRQLSPIVIVVLGGLGGLAAEAPPSSPTSAPAEVVTATEITPAARELLDQMARALQAAPAYRASGTIACDIDTAGITTSSKSDFTTLYRSPDRFRLELPGQLQVGSTGSRVHAFKPATFEYVEEPLLPVRPITNELITPRPAANQATAPTSGDARHVAGFRWPIFVRDLLKGNDPMLWMALSSDPASEFCRNMASVTRDADQPIGDQLCPTLRLVGPDAAVTRLSLRPASSGDTAFLVRRVIVDVSPVWSARGATDVRRMSLCFDYAAIETLAQRPEDSAFDWTPPDDAAASAVALAPATTRPSVKP